MIFAEARAILRSWGLLRELVSRDIAARYTGAAGGIYWAYLQPLLTLAAYYLVFDVVFAMRMGDQAPTRSVGVFLVVGVLPWMAFSDAAQRGMASLLEVGSLLQKNPLPPALFPVRSVLASMVVYGPLLLLMVLVYGTFRGPAWAYLALLPLLALQCVVSMVLAYLLAILAAALRDVVQVVGFLMSIGTFCSPILFPMSLFPAQWQWVLWLNPITPFVLAYQRILLEGLWPTYASWLAIGVWLVLTGLLLDVVVKRSRDQLVDWL